MGYAGALGAADPVGPGLSRLLPGSLLEDLPDAPPGRRSARDWVVDLALFVVGAVGGMILFGVQPDLATAPPALILADGVGGLVLSLALWWRRRWPVPFAVLAALIATFSASAAAFALIALFTVAVHRQGRVLAAVVALHVAGGVVFLYVRPDPTVPVWLGVVLVVLLVAAVVAWGMFARARRQLVVSLAERASRAEAEQHLRVEQARQTERTRIAREMHDVLAHRISLVSLHAGALEFRPEAPAAQVASSAAVIRESAHQALQDLREILGVLRADVADSDKDRPQPTLTDLPRLVEESRGAGLRLSSECAVDAASVPAGIARTAYRVVQEGLTNAHKHAGAAEVRVLVSGSPGQGLVVHVRNRRPVGGSVGAGSATGIPGAGQGLVGLAERASLAGGHLRHGSEPNGDWVLDAWLPWPA